MIFVLTPTTVANPGLLAGGTPPRKVLGRGFGLFPRRLMLDRAFWRLLLEYSLLRYVVALSPFGLAMLVWPELALPISGAPLLMFLVVLFIEGNVLSYSTPEKRRRLLDEAAIARGLDLFGHRAQSLLARIAADRDMAEGTLTLVVEQSPMARVAPFTAISLQAERPGSPFLDLDAGERRLLAGGLFDEAFTERDLQRINLAQNVFLRAASLEARTLSAHARMAALARRQAAGPAPAAAAARLTAEP